MKLPREMSLKTWVQRRVEADAVTKQNQRTMREKWGIVWMPYGLKKNRKK
jgi:hypothetical protein